MSLESQEIVESRSANERRHFLLRGHAHGNISQEQVDKEMPALEKKIAFNLNRRLKELDEELKTEINQLKQTITSDGDLKRGVARILIKFLKEDFEDEEVKGIMRQGYKIMRGQ